MIVEALFMVSNCPQPPNHVKWPFRDKEEFNMRMLNYRIGMEGLFFYILYYRASRTWQGPRELPVGKDEIVNAVIQPTKPYPQTVGWTSPCTVL